MNTVYDPQHQPQSTHLLLIRHAESLSNRNHPFAGIDSGLTARGWEQAHRLAEWLVAHEPVDVLIASPTLRARQTAEVLAQHLRQTLHVQHDLIETSQPYWEELPVLTEQHGLPDIPWHPTQETAPMYTAFCTRIAHAMRTIFERYWGQRIAIITHGGTMATMLRLLFGGHHVGVYQDNTAIHKLVWGEKRWVLIYANRTEHLSYPVHDITPIAATQPAPSNPPEHSTTSPRPPQNSERISHPLTEAQVKRLIQLARPQPEERALDVATGPGALAIALAAHVKQVTAIDHSPRMLEQAELARMEAGYENVRIRWARPDQLPFPADSFDLITCVYGLHHFQDAAKVLRELVRVCRPGGRILIHDLLGDTDPVKRATQDVIELRRDNSHVTLFAAEQMRTLVTQAGLLIEREETSEIEQHLDEWLNVAQASEETVDAVTAMLDAAIEGDAAGLQVHRERDGSLSFRQRFLTILARKPTPEAPDAGDAA